MTDLKVFNIERFALHDGPGIRTTVFLYGCPMHCPWCANPESRAGKGFRLLSTGDVLAEVLRDKAYYDESGGGITVSGGEVFCQADGLRELLAMAKEKGLHTCVETTAMASVEVFKSVIPFVDMWLVDIKHMDPGRLYEVTGVVQDTVFANLRLLDPEKVVLRLPCIPGFNLEASHFEACFSLARELGISRLDLLPYHTLGVPKYSRIGLEYPYRDYKPVAKEELEPYRMAGEEAGLETRII